MTATSIVTEAYRKLGLEQHCLRIARCHLSYFIAQFICTRNSAFGDEMRRLDIVFVNTDKNGRQRQQVAHSAVELSGDLVSPVLIGHHKPSRPPEEWAAIAHRPSVQWRRVRATSSLTNISPLTMSPASQRQKDWGSKICKVETSS